MIYFLLIALSLVGVTAVSVNAGLSLVAGFCLAVTLFLKVKSEKTSLVTHVRAAAASCSLLVIVTIFTTDQLNYQYLMIVLGMLIFVVAEHYLVKLKKINIA